MHADHARVARLLGDVTASAHSLDAAAETYSRLGAVGCLERVNDVREKVTELAHEHPDAFGLLLPA